MRQSERCRVGVGSEKACDAELEHRIGDESSLPQDLCGPHCCGRGKWWEQTTVISHVPGGPAADTSPVLPGWPWTSPNPNRMALCRLLRGILSSLGFGQSVKMSRCLKGYFKRHRQLK